MKKKELLEVMESLKNANILPHASWVMLNIDVNHGNVDIDDVFARINDIILVDLVEDIKMDYHDEIYDDAYNEGYKDGFEEGYDEGKDEGYEDGRSEGFSEGHTDGYNEGFAEGYKASCDEQSKRFNFPDDFPISGSNSPL